MRTHRTAAAALAGLLSVAIPVAATSAYAGPKSGAAHAGPKSGAKAALTRLADAEVQAGVPGVAIRVDDGHGRTIEVARQAAWSVKDHRLTASDEFRMASNTKTMVATVVLQLVAEHRLSLDDHVDRWLAGEVANDHQITVRMLLNHTSGLPDYFGEPALGRYDADIVHAVTGQDTHRWTPEELLAVAAKYPVNFAPGTAFSYSNTNYVALGLILQRITGHSVPDLLRDRILRPLGLRDSYFATDGRSRDGAKLAHGYEPDAAHFAPLAEAFGVPADAHFVGPARPDRVDVTNLSPTWAWAAGAMVSTPQDWATFLRALMSGRLLPAKLLAEMKTTVPDPATNGTGADGLGLMSYTNSCGTVWGHTGGIGGYGSQNYTDASGRRTVTVVALSQFGTKFPDAAAADQKVIDGAICAMFDRPIPN